MSFESPLWLLLLAPLAGCGLLFYRSGGQLSAELPGAWRTVVAEELRLKMSQRTEGMSSGVPLVCFAICTAIILALARPIVTGQNLPDYSNLMARVVVIDMSGEVDERELRIFAERLIEESPDIPTGLVAVASDGFNVTPPTKDHSFLMRYLSVLDSKLMPERGRRLSLGVARGEQILQSANIIVRQIVVLSGGAPVVSDQHLPRSQANRHLVAVQGDEQAWLPIAGMLGAELTQREDIAKMNEDLRKRASQVLINDANSGNIQLFLIPMVLACAGWLLLFRRRGN